MSQDSVSQLKSKIQVAHPSLSLSSIEQIITDVCLVAQAVCPAFTGTQVAPKAKSIGLAWSHKEFAPHLTDTALLPSQVSNCYGFPTGLNLSKRSIAIIEMGGAFQMKDVINYCNLHNFKVPTITSVFIDGATALSDPNGADGEVALDICVIAAIAQGVHIYVVYAPNSDQGFVDGLAKCAELGVDSVSCSWGGPETGFAQATKDAMDKIMHDAANAKGTAFFCASGDNGSTDGTMGNVCDYPASSPFAISCGGTKLQLNPDGTRGSETAWSSSWFDSTGSGGGISAAYPVTPDWQKLALPGSKAGRRSPDISGNADPNTGMIIEINGVTSQVGGTSGVAPLFAALFCMANEMAGAHVGNLHTKLYTAPADCFFDVVKGGNGGYNAAPGYDPVTGLGVPVADKLLASLIKPA